jgi:MFS family permease
MVVGSGLSSFGDSALYLTLGIWAKDLTGSNALAGMTFLFLGLPGLLGPLAGHLIDRVGRRRLMICVDLAGALIVLGLLAVHERGDLWIIYAVAASCGAVLALHGGARAGLLRDMLPDADLGSANAAFQTLSQGLRLLSPLVGAGIYATWGGGPLALLDAATFIVSAALLTTIRVTESEPEAPEPFLRAVTAGFRHLRNEIVLRRIVTAASLALAVMGFYDTVLFALTDQGLHKSPSFTGVLLSAQGAGSIAGGLTAAALLARLGESRLVAASLVLFSLGSLLAIVATLPTVLTGTFVDGIAVSWLLVGFGTALQKRTPPRLIGRTGTAANVLLDTPQMASIALGALLISSVDYRLLMLCIAVMTVACGTWLATRREPAAQPSNLAPQPVPAAVG